MASDRKREEIAGIARMSAALAMHGRAIAATLIEADPDWRVFVVESSVRMGDLAMAGGDKVQANHVMAAAMQALYQPY